MLKVAAAAALIAIASVAEGAEADKNIYGGLGLTFGEEVSPEQLAAHVQQVPETDELPTLAPGVASPWRVFMAPVLPHPFRNDAHTAHVMIDEFERVMMIVADVEADGCNDRMEWVKRTLQKKYEAEGNITVAPESGYSDAIRIQALSRTIHVACGSKFRFEYADHGAIERWRERKAIEWEAYEREQSTLAKRRLVLEQRRAVRFANEFTLGDRYRLEGAFGIHFGKPFAKNSSQQFPVDEQFFVVLPHLSERFMNGEIVLEISPERHPITIRATFDTLSFEELRDALKAKYGTPSKGTNRHVIHPVGPNRAILKRLDAQRIELAFIDTAEQNKQRERRWSKESEGL